MPIDVARRRLQITAVCDIETERWDRFVVGGLLFVDHPDRGLYETYRFRHERDFAERLFTIGGTVWAHFGGKYDFLWLLDVAAREFGLGFNPILSGSKIAMVRLGDTTFRDSSCLLNMSLSDAAQLGGIAKISPGLRCECGELGCKGHCAIKRAMNPRSWVKVEEYLRIDCEALAGALVGLQECADEADLDLCGTIGASSYRTAARWLELPQTWFKGSSADKIRREVGVSPYGYAAETFSGGRCELLRTDSDITWNYDINSAYVGTLFDIPLPTGEAKWLTGREATRAFLDAKEGCYQACVDVPREMFFPPLPLHAPGFIGLAFPVGEMVGRWTGIELRYAASVGVKIKSIQSALVWMRSETVYRGFAERIWAERAKAGPKTPKGRFYKVFGNAIYGKLGQNPEKSQVFRLGKDDDYVLKRGEEELDPAGWYIRRPDLWWIADCGNVHHAAYICAATRIKVHSHAIDDGIGGASACYCDTDSLKAALPRKNNLSDDELGKWKFEGCKPFHGRAPKTYHDGTNATMKGISRATLEDWDNASGKFGIHHDNRGVDSFLQAVRKHPEQLFKRKDLYRSIPDSANDALHRRKLLKNGDTRPMTVKELVAHQESL